MDPIEFEPRFLEALANSSNVAVLTGAGISAESGVPTFRGADGIWKKYNPMELATFEAFEANPKLVWEWYNYRREIIRKIKPNPGHYALASLAKYYNNFSLITQNVDGLHRTAGSENIYELHGNIRRNRCLECGKLDFQEEFETVPPMCACGGRLRPDVVWFGEMLPADAFEASHAAAVRSELFFTIGTSGAVQPAASLPLIAKQNGALVVEINLEPSEISHLCDIKYHGKAGEILPQIVARIQQVKPAAKK